MSDLTIVTRSGEVFTARDTYDAEGARREILAGVANERDVQFYVPGRGLIPIRWWEVSFVGVSGGYSTERQPEGPPRGLVVAFTPNRSPATAPSATAPPPRRWWHALRDVLT